VFFMAKSETAPFAWEVAVAVAGSALILFSGETQPGSFLTGLTRFGDWSYSIYLWHWPLIVAGNQLHPTMGAAVGAFLSVPAAVISFNLIERRFLNSTDARTISRIFWLFVFLPGLTLLALWSFSSVAKTETLRQADVTRAPEACGEAKTGFCVWSEGAPEPPLYVIGDSNAQQYQTALSLAGQNLGREVNGKVRLGCPPLLDLPDSIEQAAPGCRAHNEQTYLELQAAPQGLVIVSFSVIGWRTENSDSSNAEALEASVASAVRFLTAAGHTVLVVEPLPLWPEGARVGPDHCGLVFAIRSNCDAVMTLTNQPSSSDALRNAISAVNLAPGAQILKMVPIVCPQGVCRAKTPDGNWIWDDSLHVSVWFDGELATYFATEIRRLVPDEPRSPN